MSELAFNINGEAFEVPATATGWRVRRMKLKGAPEVVYGRDGMPLVLPLDAGVEDLKSEVDVGGRYRIDAVDDSLKAIDGAPPGYVQVNHDHAASAVTAAPAAVAVSDNLVIEAMRMNSELARSIVERFPQMMESAATLLRAADGAGLPSRDPRHVNEEEAEDENETQAAPPTGFDVNTVVAQLMPLLVNGLMTGKLKVPGLGAMFDWRKAKSDAEPAATTVPEPTPHRTPAHASKRTRTPSPAKSGASSGDPGETALPPIDPQMMAHFIAVQSALTPEEAALAREVASELTATELRAWFDTLAALSVPDAVAKVRTMIGAQKGGAS
jgi:hypothetical protein